MTSKFSKIIQGCMTWGVWGKNFTESEMIETLHYCIEQGITTFDHADIYGDYTTEGAWGSAFAKTKIPRDTIQIISKCGIQMVGAARPKNAVKHYQYDAEYIIKSAENSLRLLHIDYLDLLLLHRPSSLLQVEEIVKAVDHLQSTGKIKEFGLSNFSNSQTDLIRSHVEVSANQIEISLTEPSSMVDGRLDYMTVNGIKPMSWSPLGSVFKGESTQNARIKAKLKELTQKYEATEGQLVLAWLLKHPSNIHPVIGTTTRSRIKNAVQTLKIELDTQDWFALLEASQGEEVA